MPPRLFAAAPSRLRRFESAFDPIICARGVDYAARGQVHVVESSPGALVAEVRGQQRYKVALRAVGTVLRARCTCPHFEGGDACKHLWATLMVADRERLLPGGDTLRSISLDGLAAEDEEDADGDGDASLEDRPFDGNRGQLETLEAALLRHLALRRGSSPGPLPPGPWSRRHPPARGWRDVLASTSPGAHESTPNLALAYVIDRDASRSRGALVVQVLERGGRRAAAAWVPARLSLPLSREVPESDAAVLGMLAAVSQGGGAYGLASAFSPAGAFVVARPSRGFLERWLATGRVFLGEPDGPPLRWDPAPYALALSVTREAAGGDLHVHAFLERGEERVPAAGPALVLGAGFACWADRVAPVEHGGHLAWLATERESGPALLPARDVDDFIEELLRAPAAPRFALPPEHELPEVQVPGRPYALFQTHSREGVQAGPVVEAGVDYDGVRVSLEVPGRAVLDRPRRRLVLRDGRAEEVARAELGASGIRPGSGGRLARKPSPHRVALGKVEPAARALAAKGWRVEIDGRLRRAAAGVGMRVATGIDWLEVRVDARFDGLEAPVPELLAAVRQRRRSVLLSDGSLGDLSDELLEKLRRWVVLASPRGEALRFNRAQASLVAALVEGEPECSIDAGFAALRRDLQAFDDIRPVAPPRTFRGNLREYQRQALGWLAVLRRLGFGGCLADDMGLGKTVQVLAMLDARRAERPKPGPSLVVAPRSVLHNWAAEAARFTPGLRVLVHDGPTRPEPGEHFADHHLVLTTYGLVRSDLDALSRIAFDYVVLDEAQAIKTARTATAQAVRSLQARHRLALTGTPVENHLGELAALLDFLNPGLLGASSALSALAQGTNRVDDTTRATLARAVRPFFLRRTKRQVAPELPERIEQTLTCELEGEERRRYDELHAHYRRSLEKRVARDGVARSTAHILEALLRLRQAACHPGLLDDKRRGDPSAKLDLLLEQLDAVLRQGQKALVFSQFTSLLSIVRDRLEARGVVAEYLDGKTTDRAERVARFQSDERCGVFLLSLKAGGTGLNLTAAEYVFLLDPWWNP
ncbi:MAG: SWIM zinc finger family protein, partial [Myxococcales bacterium]|nr:SWIM zinc finger family protein [Myxococcales bacterium]